MLELRVKNSVACVAVNCNMDLISLFCEAPSSVVRTKAASVWEPKPEEGFRWFWLRIRGILGWILVPVVVVAISGLIQGAAA